MDHHSSLRESAGTAAPVRRTGGEGAAREGHYTERRLRTVAQAALLGGPLFLLGTVLHPERYGEGIAAAGYIYGITHDVQAFGLLLQVISLVSVYVLGAWRFGRGGVPAFFAALIGTLLWFGLIVIDGARNPVLARYAPETVHTPADLDPGVAMIVLPALLVFPVGYVLLPLLLARQGAKWTGLLLGIGAVVYTIGGLAIFALGPHSPAIQVLETTGALPYALGFVLLGWMWGHGRHEPGPLDSSNTEELRQSFPLQISRQDPDGMPHRAD